MKKKRQQQRHLSDLPISINVENKTSEALDIELFNSTKNVHGLNAPWGQDGNVESPKYAIRAGVPNVTYRDILYSLIGSPITIGATYVQVEKGNPREAEPYLKKWLLETIDACGSKVTLPLRVMKDIYQTQNDIFRVDTEYGIDGLTAINIKLPPDNTLEISFYQVWYTDIPKLNIWQWFIKLLKSIRLGKRRRLKKYPFQFQP